MQEEKSNDEGNDDGEAVVLTRNPMSRLSHHRRLSSLESDAPSSQVTRDAARSVVAHSPRRNKGPGNWKRTSGKRFGVHSGSGTNVNPAQREFEMAAARLALEDSSKTANASSASRKRKLVKGPKIVEVGDGDNMSEECCTSCCSCTRYLWHEDLRVRAAAWTVAAAMLAYAAFSAYVTADLLKLLRCMHASCDDWCFKLISASVANLTRLDDTLYVTAEIAVQWPATTEAMLGRTQISLKNQRGVQMVSLVTTDLPRFSREDGSTVRIIQAGKSTMEIDARVDIEDIEDGAEEFGKAQSEG